MSIQNPLNKQGHKPATSSTGGSFDKSREIQALNVDLVMFARHMLDADPTTAAADLCLTPQMAQDIRDLTTADLRRLADHPMLLGCFKFVSESQWRHLMRYATGEGTNVLLAAASRKPAA